jgi:hypothetical protein
MIVHADTCAPTVARGQGVIGGVATVEEEKSRHRGRRGRDAEPLQPYRRAQRALECESLLSLSETTESGSKLPPSKAASPPVYFSKVA